MPWILLLVIALGLAVALSVFSARVGSLTLQIVSAAVILMLGAIYRDFAWQDKSLEQLKRIGDRERLKQRFQHFADSGIDVGDSFEEQAGPIYPTHRGQSFQEANARSRVRTTAARLGWRTANPKRG